MKDFVLETRRRVEEARRNVVVHIERLSPSFPFVEWDRFASRFYNLENWNDLDALMRGWDYWAPIVEREFDNEEAAGFIITPQDILDYMNRVDWYASRLKEDIEAKKDVPGDIWAAFADWWAVWRKFYADHESWWNRQFSSVYDETEVKERELTQLRARFIASGGKSSTPKPEGPAVDPPGGTSFGTQIAGLAIGVAVVAGGVLYLATRR